MNPNGKLIKTLCETAGCLYPKVNFQLTSACLWTYMALLKFVVPFLPSLPWLLTQSALFGIGLGAFETGLNAFVSILWGQENMPFRQIILMILGCGTIVSPLVLEPFLMTKEDARMNETILYHPDQVKLIYPFSILSAIFASTAIFTFCVWFYFPETTNHPSRIVCDPESQKGAKDWKDSWWSIAVVVLVIFFVFLDMGVEGPMNSMIASFAIHSKIGLSPQSAARLTSLLFTCTTLTRAASVLYVPLISVDGNWVLNCILMLSASNILLFFGNQSEQLLWLGVGLMGMSTATNVPCIYGYMEQYFPVSSMISSMFCIANGVSFMLFPYIVSNFIVDQPHFFLYSNSLVSTCLAVTLITVVILCRFKLSKIFAVSETSENKMTKFRTDLS